jgi:hypothetical protein
MILNIIASVSKLTTSVENGLSRAVLPKKETQNHLLLADTVLTVPISTYAVRRHLRKTPDISTISLPDDNPDYANTYIHLDTLPAVDKWCCTHGGSMAGPLFTFTYLRPARTVAYLLLPTNHALYARNCQLTTRVH